MNIFGIAEAEHYCSSFKATTGVSTRSIDSFQANQLGSNRRIIKEGLNLYDKYRDCSLRDIERSLFFAVSLYRRCLDLMIPSASSWAHVMLYYGNWHASRALLGMFGCTIFNRVVVDIQRGTPGKQELRLQKIGSGKGQQPTTYKGSHRRFWDFFYRAVKPLYPMVKNHLAPALSPVGGNCVWQIEKRNELNYDSWIALELVRKFNKSFAEHSFPSSLPGPMASQYVILEQLLELTFSYAHQFNLQTDALEKLGQPGSLTDMIAELVYRKKAPELVGRTKRSMIL